MCSQFLPFLIFGEEGVYVLFFKWKLLGKNPVYLRGICRKQSIVFRKDIYIIIIQDL